MNTTPTRRQFLAEVGRGMLIASLGSGAAFDMGLARAEEGRNASRSGRWNRSWN